jgi:uncharacterized lipoprotein YmbA
MGQAMNPLRLALTAAGLMALAGCGHSPPTQFFTLDPLSPATSASAKAGTPIRIDRVTIPAILDRPEMVREQSAERLQVDDFNHWGAPLGDLMRGALVEDLTARLPAGRVVPAGAPSVAGVADLTVEIVAIHEAPGLVVADMDWTLTQHTPGPPGQPQVVRTLRHERIQAPLDAPSQHGFATALSRVMATLADRIVEALPAAG